MSDVGEVKAARLATARAPESPRRVTALDALVQLLLRQAALDRERGVRTGGFVSGYPGSPLGRFQDVLQRRGAELAASGIHQTPGLNEELAATAVWGTQTVTRLPGATVDGVFSMWYGKAPGVDRAADAFRHGNIRGTHRLGGVLAVAGDDPRANATVFPTDSTAAFAAWGMPVLFPADVQEIVSLGLHGVEMSRACGLWVGFKLVTDVADGSGFVDDIPFRSTVPTVEIDGRPFLPRLRAAEPGPPMRDAEQDLVEGRRLLAERYIELNELNPVVVDSPRARVGIVAPGTTYVDLRSALRELGLADVDALAGAGLRVKKVSALHPIGESEWRQFAHGLEHVVVVEEKQPFLELSLKAALYGEPSAPEVIGKTFRGSAAFPKHGALGPDEIGRVLAPVLGQVAGLTLPSPGRPPASRRFLPLLVEANGRRPFFCSGCPHNTSLVAPEGAVVGAGIGCHIMSMTVGRPEYGFQSDFTQMGGEGAQWVGQAPFTTTEHIFQNIGDGTFHHSASLAVRLAVASQVNITYKLLYNSAVGMTGGQQVKGLMALPELTRSLMAEGVARIIVTTDDVRRHRRARLADGVSVWKRSRLVEAQEVLAATPGVTVLIHDQQCAAERRRLWSRGEQEKTTERVMISERVCEGCGDCNAKSQCLSVQPIDTAFGRKTAIAQSSCNLDFSCVQGDCPSFMTVDVRRVKRTRPTKVDPPAVAPPPSAPGQPFRAHLVGIGGSGVVSTNSIIAAAAASEGLSVQSLDLPGSSIKAGPVVSQTQAAPVAAADHSNRISDGQADVFLAFDLVGAMDESVLRPLSAERTTVFGSVSVEPTGRMAYDPSAPLPSVEEMREVLDMRSRREDNLYLDAAAIAQAATGSTSCAGTVIVGAAVQSGALPLSPSAVEQAIEAAGVAVEDHLRAFGWGRAVAVDPRRLADLGLTPVTTAVDDIDLGPEGEILESLPAARATAVGRGRDLAEYQSDRYARTYLERVIAFAHAVDRRDGAETLVQEYARGLHKLMAYKDEYEVARLLLADEARAAVLSEFGPGARVSWNLHPPVLRALGVNRKVRLGPWFAPVLRGLRALRRVRGTWMDPFGWARTRRLERLLVDHYVGLVGRHLATGPTDEELGTLVSLPEKVRGYEGVKARSVLRYLDAVEASLPSGDDAEVRQLRQMATRLADAH